jgi:hypothetical protein
VLLDRGAQVKGSEGVPPQALMLPFRPTRDEEVAM